MDVRQGWGGTHMMSDSKRRRIWIGRLVSFSVQSQCHRCSWRLAALMQQVCSCHTAASYHFNPWYTNTCWYSHTVNVHGAFFICDLCTVGLQYDPHTLGPCVCVFSGLSENSGITISPIPKEQKLFLLTTSSTPFCGECVCVYVCVKAKVRILPHSGI